MRKIFMSDIHLMDERSFSPGKPYFWLSRQRGDLLATFLEKEILEADDVEELIINGDFLDNWVCPVDFVPQTFQEIIDNPEYGGIVQNLRAIAASNTKLTYVAGNHDLQVDEETMLRNFPGINFIKGTDTEIAGIYRKDGIIAEHGNRNAFFCGVNPDPDHVLPIGFFFSRFGAERRATTGRGPDILDIARQHLPDLIKFLLGHREEIAAFFKNIIITVAKDCGLNEDSSIQMGNLDNFGDSITVGEVAEYFKDIIDRWNAVKPGGVEAWSAVSDKIGGLLGRANRLVYNNEREPANIVIYGHDHSGGVIGEKKIGNVPTRETQQRYAPFIYANGGSWTDKNKYCTFVETEIKRNRHYVRLYRYWNVRSTNRYKRTKREVMYTDVFRD